MVFKQFLQNPYVVGPPLIGLDGYGFYGRKEVFEFLFDHLNAVRRPAILLYGHRRIGKSSILHQMPRFMPPDWKIVFYDTQGQADDPLAEILYGIAYEIDQKLDLGGVEQEDITPETFRSQFLPKAFAKLNNQKNRLVLLFDEFDVLDPTKPNSDAGRVFRYIRSLVNSEQEVGFIFVVGRRPDEIKEIFRDISTIVYRIGRLTREETENLIRALAGEHLHFSQDAIEHIWQLTSGHPLATQLLCSELWHGWVDGGEIQPSDIDKIVPKALVSGTNQIQWIYDGIEQPLYRLFLSAAASAQKEDGQARLDEILADLRSHQVTIGANLDEVRTNLANWDILIDQGETFKFSVEIFRLWVIQYRSLQRMMHEAPLVSERAYDFYRAAERLRLEERSQDKEKDSVVLQEAVTTYRRALQINPLLVAARVGLASTLLELNQLDEALEESRRAFEVDPGQSGIVREVLLRRGETLEGQGEDENALVIYNQALQLGEDHQTRTRLNNLLVKKGERLFKETDYPQAIDIFRQAGAGDRAKAAQEAWDKEWNVVLSTLADKEASADWEGAQSDLDKYKTRFPQDPRIASWQKELNDKMSTAWRQQAETFFSASQFSEAAELFEKAGESERAAEARLQADRLKKRKTVEELESQGKWEEALKALEDYKTVKLKSESISAWRTRLREKWKADLETTIKGYESSASWDQAWDVMKVYLLHFSSPEAKEWQQRLFDDRKPVFLDRAKQAAHDLKYDESIKLLEESGNLDQIRPVLALGLQIEWHKQVLFRFIWWGISVLTTLLGALVIRYLPFTGFFYSLLKLLVSVACILGLYFTFRLLFNDVWFVPRNFWLWRRPVQVDARHIHTLPVHLWKALCLCNVKAHSIALALLFGVMEVIFRLSIGSRLSWWDPAILMALGAFAGWSINMAIFVDQTGSEKAKRLILGSTIWGIMITSYILTIVLVFILPYITFTAWGNYAIARGVTLVLSFIFYILLVVGNSDFWNDLKKEYI